MKHEEILLRRIKWFFTPAHTTWLNMAEIGNGMLSWTGWTFALQDPASFREPPVSFSRIDRSHRPVLLGALP